MHSISVPVFHAEFHTVFFDQNPNTTNVYYMTIKHCSHCSHYKISTNSDPIRGFSWFYTESSGITIAISVTSYYKCLQVDENDNQMKYRKVS